VTAAESWGEPVAAWERTTSQCDECATVYDGAACPCCGEQAGASPVGVIGYVSERDDGAWLTMIETRGDGVSLLGRRQVSDEQARWLRR